MKSLEIKEIKQEADLDPSYGTNLLSCIECNWSGYMKDCKVRYESESWEFPHEYPVLTCPKCKNDIDC